MLIDIHTHLPSQDPTNLSFLVGKHSLGIHPWDLALESTLEELRGRFENLKNQYHQGIFAIGECGLDRRRRNIAPISLQLQVLEWQIDWAREVNRPLIIHSVHAYSDLVMILTKKKYTGKILLHDFRGNFIEMRTFLESNLWQTWFSFGDSLFRKNSKTPSLILKLPAEKIFLETDDQKEISLMQIYQKVSELWNIDQLQLENRILENLLVFFKDLNYMSASDLINHLR